MYWVGLSPETAEFFWTHEYADEPGGVYDRVRIPRMKAKVQEWVRTFVYGKWEVKVVETLLDKDGVLINTDFKTFSWYEAKMKNQGFRKSETIIIGFEDQADAAKFKLFWG